MRRRHWLQVDDDSLQTDVMRFMAIVAFCLIAILAMVRDTAPAEPESPADTPAKVAAAQEVPEVPQPISEPRPIPPAVAVIKTKPTPKPEPRKSSTNAPAERVQPPDPAPMTTRPKPQTQAQAQAHAQPVESNQQGLTLRFSSESDFLRLVARGKVAVYAFDQATFLALGPNYQFQPAQPPNQVYELEPSTIPDHLSAALPAEVAQQQLKWAVGLPRRVERQIRSYVDTVDTGELLINKYEEVRHVPPR